MVLDLCITICARSGSKRLIDKNIKKIHGKTLIDISITQALSVVPPNNIIFSSDSERYINIAKKHNIKIHKRGAKLSSDKSDKLDVIKTISKQINLKFIIDLDVTAPIRDKEDILGIYKFLKNGKDIAYGACKMESINPYFNMVEVKKNKKISTVKKYSKKISGHTTSISS